MTMHRKTVLAAAAAMVLTSASFPAHAAEEKAPAAAKLTPEQIANIRRAGGILRAFSFAMQTANVQKAVKGRLLSCLYNNKLSTISEAAGKIIKENSSLSDDKPGDVYRAAAGVCGVTFKEAQDGKAPASSSDSSEEGR